MTTSGLKELGYPAIEDVSPVFLNDYNEMLMKHDVEDFFGLRFSYKSKLLKEKRLFENSSNDVSLTYHLTDEEEAKMVRENPRHFDELVRTA